MARVTTPPGMMPPLISESPKVASSAATARSQATSGVKAPPKHQPLTMALVGLGEYVDRRHCQLALTRLMRAHSIADLSWLARKYSLRSMPAEKASPAPVSTRTPQRSSVSSASMVSSISWVSGGFMALRLSGRLRLTQAMPSSNSTNTLAPQGDCGSELLVVMSSPAGCASRLRSPVAFQHRRAPTSAPFLHGLRRRQAVSRLDDRAFHGRSKACPACYGRSNSSAAPSPILGDAASWPPGLWRWVW